MFTVTRSACCLSTQVDKELIGSMISVAATVAALIWYPDE